jgi:peptidoglycan-N-acetylglucosamine deacetylase
MTVQPPLIVTTSWDDGDPLDLKIAEILHSRDMSGTFYVPILPYNSCRMINHSDLTSLTAGGFEIGAHGLSHSTLPGLSVQDLVREVQTCKDCLEQVVGKEVRMLAYPKGRYNAQVVRCLKTIGYQGARTTQMLAHKLDFDPFTMPTTVHVYPHTTSEYFRNLARYANFTGAIEYVRHLRNEGSWVELGKRYFDLVLEQGGVWHLLGHSWQIDQKDLWKKLNNLLDYVCKRENVLYASNGNVLKFLPSAIAKLAIESY